MPLFFGSSFLTSTARVNGSWDARKVPCSVLLPSRSHEVIAWSVLPGPSLAPVLQQRPTASVRDHCERVAAGRREKLLTVLDVT